MNKNKGRYLYISLALAALASFVLACDPTGTPPPPPPALTPPPPVVPTFPMRAVHVGMREFMVETHGGEGIVSFIATRSATAPEWSAVEKNPALLTRKLGKDKGNRLIYFSVTDKYNVNKPFRSRTTNFVITVDINQRAAGQSEADYTDEVAPGMMVPNTKYYVYAYQNGALLWTSPAITTKDYPAVADLPGLPAAGEDVRLSDHMWGMDAWKTSDPNKLRTIEIKATEPNFLPVRLSLPVWNPTTCTPNSHVIKVLSGTIVASLDIANNTASTTGWYVWKRQPSAYPASVIEANLIIGGPQVEVSPPSILGGLKMEQSCIPPGGFPGPGYEKRFWVMAYIDE